jgi:hypothetical protein
MDLTSVRPLWDLSRVNFLACVFLGCVVAGLFLAGLEFFWLGFVKCSSSLQVVFWGCFCSRA